MAQVYDMATGPMRDRLAKLIGEKFARHIGFKLGQGVIGDKLRAFAGGNPAALAALGIGGAAAITSPRALAQWIASITTFDVNKVDEVLNEGVDSGIQSLVEATANRHAGLETATDAEFAEAANKALKQLEEKGKLSLDRLERKVVADGLNRVFHALDCPVVWKSSSRQKSGKDKDDKTETTKTTYKDGHREVTLRWALENKYAPTTGSCCGETAKSLVEDALKSPKDIFACVDSLKSSTVAAEIAARNSFYTMLAQATPAQRARLQDIGGDRCWQPSEIVTLLTQAGGRLDVFLNMLETKVVRPKQSVLEQGADWLKRNWRALVGVQAETQPGQAQQAAGQPADTTEVDALRRAVDGFNRNLERDIRRKRRRGDELEAEFHRRR